VPSAVVGLVIALCALLLLKWLAVVALVVVSAALLGRWVWRRHRAPEPTRGRGDDPGADVPVADPVLPRRRVEAPRAPADDCSWCGLSGGHWAPDGARLRPRHAHTAR